MLDAILRLLRAQPHRVAHLDLAEWTKTGETIAGYAHLSPFLQKSQVGGFKIVPVSADELEEVIPVDVCSLE